MSLVEVCAQLAVLAPLPEGYPQPLLVATPLALEVPPLADEGGRRVALLGDHSQVRAQREPDPLGRAGRVGSKARATGGSRRERTGVTQKSTSVTSNSRCSRWCRRSDSEARSTN